MHDAYGSNFFLQCFFLSYLHEAESHYNNLTKKESTIFCIENHDQAFVKMVPFFFSPLFVALELLKILIYLSNPPNELYFHDNETPVG